MIEIHSLYNVVFDFVDLTFLIPINVCIKKKMPLEHGLIWPDFKVYFQVYDNHRVGGGSLYRGLEPPLNISKIRGLNAAKSFSL